MEIEMNKLEVFNNEDYITDSYVAILRNRYNHQLLVQQQSVEELKSILPLLETSKDSSIVEQIKHVISTLEVTRYIYATLSDFAALINSLTFSQQ